VSAVEIVLALVKIVIMVAFFLNMAAVTTWFDRRQGAMIQDRVGPNRAVFTLPSVAARIVALLPPSLLGVLALFAMVLPEIRGRVAFERMTLGIQGAVFVAWFGLVLLTARVAREGASNAFEERLEGGNPRTIFYAGLTAHVLGFVVARMVPIAALPNATRVVGVVLMLVLFGAGLYTAALVGEGGVEVRLAGTLHAMADAVKLLWKEDFIPKNADRLLHSLAPIMAMFPAFVTFAVIPFGDPLCFADNGNTVFDAGDLARVVPVMSRSFQCPGGHVVPLQIADLNVGILYIFAIAGTGVVGAAIAGWSSDNKFSLLGGLRAASQMVSYEVAMGLSLVGLLMIYGSIRLAPMVDWQGENAWGIFVQPLGFVLFLAALVAETKRVPFDQPEGESEIVAGYFLEYSGAKFMMFYTGEYIEFIVSGAILVTLFFGGYHLPFLHPDGVTVAFGDSVLFEYKMTHLAVTVVSALVFFGKTIFMTFAQVFIRWTLPRFRYDQLMRLGWTRLLPLALANIFVTGIVLLAIDSAGPGVGKALQFLADVSQAVVALGMVAGLVAFVVWLLEPVERTRFLASTSARFAAAQGGVKPEPQQA
jgi:NADH-quinone oxidoreductase subunit H